ncbi:MAG: SRPBCC family protein [Ilumatobacteraceae bacterium]
MDVTAALDAPCPPAELFALIEDLGSYPRWLELVHRAEPEQPSAATAASATAWRVDLRARLGPLARSKRLRMERTEHDGDMGRVRFERRELDGRRHAPWVLTATVEPDGDGSALTMHLHYGGKLWTGGVLERVLNEQIQQGRTRLLNLSGF